MLSEVGQSLPSKRPWKIAVARELFEYGDYRTRAFCSLFACQHLQVNVNMDSRIPDRQNQSVIQETLVDELNKETSFLHAFRLGSPKPAYDSWPFIKTSLTVSAFVGCSAIFLSSAVILRADFLQHFKSTIKIPYLRIPAQRSLSLSTVLLLFPFSHTLNHPSSRHVSFLSRLPHDFKFFYFYKYRDSFFFYNTHSAQNDSKASLV